MHTTLRNSLLALTVVGALSLAACKTTDDTMDAPVPAADQPATDSSTAPMDSTTTPVDDSMPPAEDTDSTQDDPAPTTP